MAMTAYLTMAGSHSGNVKGGARRDGRDGLMAISAVSHEIEQSHDPQSGLPTGRRQHKPVRITKQLDSATPTLLAMLTTNENVKEWRLDFFGKNAEGVEKNTYRIELTNAHLTSYELTQPARDDSKSGLDCCETIAFVYEQITWTSLESERSASDSWEVRT
jgi:type VI secretion system secreted protein Hcp